MITHIIIEFTLAIAILYTSTSFWQLLKRDNFLKEKIGLNPFLEDVILRNSLDEPNPQFAVYAEKHQLGYASNIHCVIEADRKTINRLEMIFGAIGITVTALTCVLGLPYLVLSCLLFVLPVFLPITQSAQRSAIDHIMEIAVILYRWRSDNPMEYNSFISSATSLQALHKAIENAYKDSRKGPRTPHAA